MKKMTKLSLLLASIGMAGASVSTLKPSPVFAGEAGYYSPTVVDGNGPAIQDNDNDPNNGNAVLTKDGTEYQITIEINLWADVSKDPQFTDADKDSKNGIIFDVLSDTYTNYYLEQPIRAFNPDILTSDLARELSGNDDFDATNFTCRYIFDLRLSGEIEDEYLNFLYARPENCIIVNFKMEIFNNQIPVIVYRCDEGKYSNNQPQSAKWEVNQTGKLVEGTTNIVQYRFYSLCPMLFVETAEHTFENEMHPEWSDPTSDKYVAIVDGGKDWIVPITIASTVALVIIGICVFSSAKKKQDEEVAAE